MKKLFLFLCVLPFFCFASFDYNGYTFDRVKIFTWLSPSVTSTSGQSPLFRVDSPDQIYDLYLSNPFGLSISYSGSSTTFVVPANGSSSFSVAVSSNTKVTITNSLYAVSNGVGFAFSPAYFPRVKGLFFVASGLYTAGYRGPGITEFPVNSARVDINVFFPDLISGVFTSTNNAFRSMLISSLSSISDMSASSAASLSSIDVSSSSSAASLSSIDANLFNYLSSIDTNLFSILSSVSSNLSSSSSSGYTVESLRETLQNIADESAGEGFDFSKALFDLDRDSWDSGSKFDSIYDFWADAYVKGIPLVSALIKGVESYSPGVSGRSGFEAIGYQFNSTLSSDFGKGVISLSNSLSSVSSRIDGVGSSLGNALGGVNSSLDSGFSNLVSVSSFGPDSALAALFAGDPSKLAAAHTDPEDPLNPNNPNSILNPMNPAFVGGGGGIHGAFTTNNVVKPLSNVVHHAESSIITNIVDGAKNLSSNVVYSAKMLDEILDKINKLLENLTTPNSGESISASVRIVGPLDNGRVAVDLPWGPGDLFNVDVFSNIVVDAFSSFNPDLVITNIPDYTPYLEQLISNTAPYRLWTDYESLMDSDWSSVSGAALDDSFKDSISDFDLIGKDFWHYFTYVSGRQVCDIHSLASIFTNLLPLVDFINSQDFGTDDNGNSKSIFDVGSEVISSYPSRSAIEDYISQVTNSSHAVSASTNELSRLASSTNTVHDILGRYFLDKGSSLPSSLVFLKLSSPDGGVTKDFEIPLSDRQELWSTLRASITVVFTLVNLILLPKFLLMVFRLFMRLFNRSLPFLDSKE